MMKAYEPSNPVHFVTEERRLPGEIHAASRAGFRNAVADAGTP